MHERVYQVLEFDKVKQQIQNYAACSLGRERIAELVPCERLEDAEAELDMVDEALQYLYRHGSLPFGGITDIRSAVRKAAIGGVLSAEELNRIVQFIVGARRARQAIEHAAEEGAFSRLADFVQAFYDARQLEVDIRQAVSEDGTLFDHASPELRRIRTSIRQLEGQMRRQLEQMLRTHQRYLQDPVIAVRGDRLCLPVKVEYKSQVPGAVHDYSASGATVFVEPQAVLESGAKVRALQAEEEREIERILQALSALVAAAAEDLLENVRRMGLLDFWFAKAAYAKSQRCERPRLRADGVWRLIQARHPLIDMETAVPVDLTLGDNYRMLIITGPNTGGKTVTLKTVGLLTLLAMSGCFIPTGRPSDIGWCDQIFADIGDEQSIEQSLSTFSSHLRNIVEMLREVTAQSLVLLDELGAGTDPAEGAALSMAILDHLNRWQCRVVATTHYAELKAYAFQEPQAMNASVEFDVQTLRPTYRLLVGVPGRSNALAIASRLGLSNAIVERARSLLTTDDVRMEELIAKMEQARHEAEALRREAAEEHAKVSRLRAELEAEWNDLTQEAEELRARAEREARDIVRRAEREAERVIQELRQLRDAAQVKDHQLVELRKALQNALPEDAPKRRKKSSVATGEISVGAQVRVLSLGQKGEVIEKSDDGRSYTVQLGLLRMKVDAGDVELLGQPKPAEATQSFRRGMPKSMPLQLDIRGTTVDESIPTVDKYLDDAVVHGLARVTVIHGKGTGALRDGIRRYLTRHPHVKSWAPGGPGEGGDGATVVELK
ncbi:endonuclease MutS2 [Alicyclobacillus contaminans]|uniref:endonuclease MutS2 n=1 Tax=Alicyclobacillus contaminans TaxID=392016 RepID=UPI00047CE7E0|nr:endonuclease MutS2 [Alicyclobacillus contaminans]